MVDKEKAGIREVISMLDPLKEDVTLLKVSTAEIKTLLLEHLKRYDKFCENNEIAHDILKSKIQAKISIKSFIAWLTGVSILMGIILTILKVFNVI